MPVMYVASKCISRGEFFEPLQYARLLCSEIASRPNYVLKKRLFAWYCRYAYICACAAIAFPRIRWRTTSQIYCQAPHVAAKQRNGGKGKRHKVRRFWWKLQQSLCKRRVSAQRASWKNVVGPKNKKKIARKRQSISGGRYTPSLVFLNSIPMFAAPSACFG